MKMAANGLVLMGGKSLRMGQDKSLLTYHEKAQYQHCYELLSKHCEQVFLSCRSAGAYEFPSLIDSEKYADSGPMNALFTAFEQSKQPWLILAIDYPLFDEQDLQKLIKERDEHCMATVYYQAESGYYEPFLGIYEVACFELIRTKLDHGKNSMQELLHEIPVKKVFPLDSNHLKSIDKPEDFMNIQDFLKHEKSRN